MENNFFNKKNIPVENSIDDFGNKISKGQNSIRYFIEEEIF